MSDHLRVVGLLLILVGAALLVVGRSGVPLPALAVVTLLGVVALAVSFVLRRREPRTTTATAHADGHRARWKIGAVAGAALAIVALLLGLFFAEGEARGHVFFHLMFGLAALGLFVALALLWDRATAQRGPFLVVLWIASTGVLLEGIGGAGYDRFNAGRRVPWLTSLHNLAATVGASTIIVLPIAVVVLAIVVVAKLRGSAAPAG